MINKLIKEVEDKHLRPDPLTFEVGDTVDVHCRILEGTKERVQIFTGVVLARRGAGTREMFTVRRLVGGEGVEPHLPGQLAEDRQAGSRPPRQDAEPSCTTSASVSAKPPSWSNAEPRNPRSKLLPPSSGPVWLSGNGK